MMRNTCKNGNFIVKCRVFSLEHPVVIYDDSYNTIVYINMR